MYTKNIHIKINSWQQYTVLVFLGKKRTNYGRFVETAYFCFIFPGCRSIKIRHCVVDVNRKIYRPRLRCRSGNHRSKSKFVARTVYSSTMHHRVVGPNLVKPADSSLLLSLVFLRLKCKTISNMAGLSILY